MKNNKVVFSMLFSILCSFAIFIAICFAVWIWFFSTKNYAISLEEQIYTAQSTIRVAQQRRHDAIKQILQVVEKHMKHEKGMLSEITKARGALAKGAAEEAMANIKVIVEAYPNISAEKSFVYLNNEISSVENQIKRARDNANMFVREYRRYVRVFPSSKILSIQGYEVQIFNYYENTEDSNQIVTDMFK